MRPNIDREQIEQALADLGEGFQPPLQEQAEHWTWFPQYVEQDEDRQLAHCTVVLVFEDVPVQL